MGEIGRKLLIIRQQRKLSLRQVERLTTVIANRYGDKARRVSASWLGRIERGSHSITHKRLESLEEVYGVSHDELTDESVLEDEASRSLRVHLPDVPAAVLKGLTGIGGPLMPPESWLDYFPDTTLLPPPSKMIGNSPQTARKHSPDSAPLYGVLGAGDNTLIPFMRPGAIVEINSSIRTVNPRRFFCSVFERPIYFLRSHDGYHCGWCELDSDGEWLTLVSSAMAVVPHRRWRYRQEVEVVGQVGRVLTRLGFPKGREFMSSQKRSNST
ncbi:MAG TPA: helix-turn-helix transcriptional regulator [Edaphobacter sp.]|nr:helix-turn-helix transcriptional regulator [Edaphobacter sp.]